MSKKEEDVVPKEVELTVRQKKALLDNSEIVQQAKQQYDLLLAKQQEALSLVLDAHGFDTEKVANVEIQENKLVIHET